MRFRATVLLRVSFFAAREKADPSRSLPWTEANGLRMTCHSERSEESAFAGLPRCVTSPRRGKPRVAVQLESVHAHQTLYT
jgi:hypothetical protein